MRSMLVLKMTVGGPTKPYIKVLSCGFIDTALNPKRTTMFALSVSDQCCGKILRRIEQCKAEIFDKDAHKAKRVYHRSLCGLFQKPYDNLIEGILLFLGIALLKTIRPPLTGFCSIKNRTYQVLKISIL